MYTTCCDFCVYTLYICINIHICRYTYTYIFACINVFIRTHKNHMYKHMTIYTHTYTHIHTDMCVYIYLYMYIYICIWRFMSFCVGIDGARYRIVLCVPGKKMCARKKISTSKHGIQSCSLCPRTTLTFIKRTSIKISTAGACYTIVLFVSGKKMYASKKNAYQNRPSIKGTKPLFIVIKLSLSTRNPECNWKTSELFVDRTKGFVDEQNFYIFMCVYMKMYVYACICIHIH